MVFRKLVGVKVKFSSNLQNFARGVFMILSKQFFFQDRNSSSSKIKYPVYIYVCVVSRYLVLELYFSYFKISGRSGWVVILFQETGIINVIYAYVGIYLRKKFYVIYVTILLKIFYFVFAEDLNV